MRHWVGFFAVALSVRGCSSDGGNPSGVAGAGGVAGTAGAGGSGGTGGTASGCSGPDDCLPPSYCSLASHVCLDGDGCVVDADCASGKCGKGSESCLEPGACKNHGDCDPGQACDVSTQQCVVGTACGSSELGVTRLFPNVLLLLQRGVSMAQDLSGESRWNAARFAISTATTFSDDTARVGLGTYSACEPGGCSAGSVVVPIAASNASAVNAFLANTVDQGSADGKGSAPGGKTQYLCDSGAPEASLGKSLEALVGEASLGDPTRRNVVVVLTDTGDDAQCVSGCDAACAAGKLAAQSPPVQTYVLGLGADAAVLDPIAAAGGSGQSKVASGKGELETALTALMQSFCDFHVDQGPPDDAELRVYFDGVAVPKGEPNGWSYDAVTKRLTFHGGSCQSVPFTQDMDVVYGCWGPTSD